MSWIGSFLRIKTEKIKKKILIFLAKTLYHCWFVMQNLCIKGSSFTGQTEIFCLLLNFFLFFGTDGLFFIGFKNIKEEEKNNNNKSKDYLEYWKLHSVFPLSDAICRYTLWLTFCMCCCSFSLFFYIFIFQKRTSPKIFSPCSKNPSFVFNAFHHVAIFCCLSSKCIALQEIPKK